MKQKVKQQIEALCASYPTKRVALLPALWAVQEAEGWVPSEERAEIAALLDITPAEVDEVASFYTMFARKPIGKHHIQVCVGVCCGLKGSDAIVEHLKNALSIEVGQSTADEQFHLSTVECLGSCGTAPMMQIDNQYYEGLTTEKVNEILLSFRPNEQGE